MNDIKSGEKKRLYLYDNLKFLLIVLVVLGHLIDDSTVKLFGDGGGETGVPQAKVFSGAFVFLYAFHMPLFFFISGWLYEGKNNFEDGFPKFVLKRTRRLLIPYFVFLMLNFVYWTIVERHFRSFDQSQLEIIY